MTENKGFDLGTIAEYREKMAAAGTSWIMDEEDDDGDEYAHFYFVGTHEGKEVIYDTVMYTLRLEHESELFELAEQRAEEHFPEYRKITYEEGESGNVSSTDQLEEEIGLYIAEVIMELEEEEAVKVREHVDKDMDTDFGIILDVGLHREKITPSEIARFIRDFSEGTLNLDDSLYSFQSDDNE